MSNQKQHIFEQEFAEVANLFVISMVRQKITEALKELQISYDGPITVEHPEDSTHGNFATNISFVVAKIAKKSPQQIGEQLAETLSKSKEFEKVEFVLPGFINFSLAKKVLVKEVEAINKLKECYGDSSIGSGNSIEIEFISANPTGPLTVHNMRGGFMGDALARVLAKPEFAVTREYYINDMGNQVKKLGESVFHFYQKENGESFEFPEDGYKGDYIEETAKELHKENQSLTLEEVTQKALERNIESIKKSTEKLGIEFDIWFSEKTLHESGKVDEALQKLTEAGKTYQKDDATWLKSSEYGDDKDRVLIKSDGLPTYVMPDIAYHFNKLETRGFNQVINIWGADHHGDIKRLKAGLNFISKEGETPYDERVEILLMSLMRIEKDGKEFRMSKRKGQFILIDEILETVPVDVLRFFTLMYDAGSPMTLDLDLALDTSERNPLYYVQYAHARMASILRKAKEEGLDESSARFDEIELEELQIISELLKFPEIVHSIAKTHDVHQLSHYAILLAKQFHAYYHQFQVLTENKERSAARVQIVRAVKTVLKNTLEIIGVEAPELM